MRFPGTGAVAAALLLTLGVAACGSSSSSAPTTTSPGSTATSAAPAAATTTTTAAPAGASTIDISGFAFKPSPSTFKVGTTVKVSNMDSTNHSLTADDGSFDTGIFDGGTKTITLSKAGTFSIHCRIHSFMTGTIVVTP